MNAPSGCAWPPPPCGEGPVVGLLPDQAFGLPRPAAAILPARGRETRCLFGRLALGALSQFLRRRRVVVGGDEAAGLPGPELGVFAAEGKKLGMGALLDDLALVDDVE